MRSVFSEMLSGGNYIAPFLWLHNEDDSLIVRELERIHECGIGAVCLESRTHDEFCRDGWWSDIRLIFDTCRRLGMKVWILDDKHFPSGYANGAFEHGHDDLLIKEISEHHVDIVGPVRGGAIIADGFKEEKEDELLAAIAMKRLPGEQIYTGEMYDLTGGYKDGMLYFDLPEGVYSVALLMKTRSGVRNRTYGDKLDPRATDVYIDAVYQPHYDRFADEFGGTFLGFFSDEPGIYNDSKRSFAAPIGERFTHYPWNDYVAAELEKTFGAGYMKKLCGIWFDFADGTSQTARTEYMNIVTRLYDENFGSRIGRWCEEHGCMYIGHVIEDNNTHYKLTNGNGHYFRALAGQHMSGIDVVLHQIVPGLTEYSNTGCVSYRQMDNVFFHYVLAKLGSSLAVLDKKKNGLAMCEIFGAYGWAEGTKLMKYLTDHMLVRGINYFVPHAFSPKPDDPDCPPNFYDSGKNPEYRYFGALMQYMNRMSRLLSGGEHVCDVGLIYDAEAAWSAKDRTPMQDIAKVLYDSQIDYEIVPYDLLSESAGRYKVIILPYASYIPPEDLAALKKIGGAPDVKLICVGSGGRSVPGFGFVPLDSLAGYLSDMRDVTLSDSSKFVRAMHYRKSGSDVYMLINEDITKTVETSVRLRGFGGGKYLLSDIYGCRASVFDSPNGLIDVTLPPYQSVVIIPGESDTGEFEPYDEILYRDLPGGRTVRPEWEISVCAEKDYPDFRPYRTVSELINIASPDEMPDFAGHIMYKAVFDLDDSEGDGRLILDLGDVGEVSQAELNGRPLGVRRLPPHRYDITDSAVKQGNVLTVTVSTTSAYRYRDPFSKFLLLEPEGLLGPVRIIRV